jgi:SAM-dependent methyltransferase
MTFFLKRIAALFPFLMIFFPLPKQHGAGNVSVPGFIDYLQAIPRARVLELGTRRNVAGPTTIHRHWSAKDAEYICSDFIAGQDVDVVADIHTLAAVFQPNSFDAIIACSVFEHVQRPWIAARQIAEVLKPGGRVLIQTHFAHPLHGYPNDYWRFSTEALETLFADAGLKIIASGYDYPCQIVSRQVPGSARGEAYLNVSIIACKPE